MWGGVRDTVVYYLQDVTPDVSSEKGRKFTENQWISCKVLAPSMTGKCNVIVITGASP